MMKLSKIIFFFILSSAQAAPTPREYVCTDKTDAQARYEIQFSTDRAEEIEIVKWSPKQGYQTLFSRYNIYNDPIDFTNDCFYTVTDFPNPFLSFDCGVLGGDRQISGRLEMGFGSENVFDIISGPHVDFANCQVRAIQASLK